MLKKVLQKQASIILTKLRIPHGPKTVRRNRLIQELNEGTKKRLTLLSAPAGFGKTTLLIEWSRQTDFPVAWVSLDPEDDDPLQFWIYFFTSIEYLYPDIGGQALNLLQKGGNRTIEAILTFLINEVEHITSQFVIVLDDYHIVNTPAINAGLIFLIEHIPENIRMVVASRTSPPFPLERMRIRGELAEIQSRNLRFTLEETSVFLKEIMNLDVSMDHIISLNNCTEGWIAGLQIAALSIRGKTNISEFINTFSNSNRYIYNYLMEEVVEKLPSNIQSFLFYTSIMDRLNAGLCDAIMNQTGSQEILAQLEKNNLFIIQVDDSHYWYQYHQLLVNTLRFRLEEQEPKHIVKLHERAANWFETNGFYSDALKEYFAASNFSYAARLMSQVGMDWLYRGELGRLLNWLEKLPKDIINQYPSLLIYYAWCLISSEYHLEVAEECLKQAENLLHEDDNIRISMGGRGDLSEEYNLSINSLVGAIYHLYSFLARLRGNLSSAIDYAQISLRTLPDNDFIWRGWAAWNLAEAHRYRGDVSQWSFALDEAIINSKAANKHGIILLTIDNLAELQVVQGQLYLAEKTWNHGLRYADGKLEGKQSLLACTIYSGLGLLYYEWNRLDIAKQHLLTALNIAQRGGLIEIILESSISLGRLLIQQGEHQAGLKMLYDLEPIILAREKTKHAIRAKAYITLWEYMQGNRDHFYNWMRTRQLSLDDTPEYINESEYWILSRLMIREGGREEVLKLLQRIEEAGRTNGRVMTEIKALVLRAGLLERYGETAKALVPLQRALTLAEPGGFIRTFIEASSYMFGLLNKYAARSPQSEYVRRLLSEFEGFAMQQSMVPTLVEPLSERELEVLQLIAARLSSREIAVELNISVNTARTHIRNIYGKMDVHSHQEVALRAETLGLIH